LAGADRRDGISSLGWATGYVGGFLHLALSLVLVGYLGASSSTARLVMVFAGVWWAAFVLLPLRWLRDRPPLESSGRSLLASGFSQLAQTLRHLRSYPLTLMFLLAFLVYNDGIQTVISLASTYGTEELKLTQSVLATTILIVQLVAFLGALLLGWIANRVGAWKTVLGSLVAWTVIVVLAFRVPAGSPTLFMLLGAGIGVVLGGSQALSRSLFSQLIPGGREAEYFGFYAISDKGTSWLGPLVFGLVYQMTTSYRAGIVSLVVFFVLGFFLLLAVPVRRAIVAAGNTPPRLL
jgi:UMF1 family MFS transporter